MIEYIQPYWFSYWPLSLLLMAALWLFIFFRAQRLAEPRLMDTYSKAKRYIAQTAEADRLAAPTFLVFGLVVLLLGVMPNPAHKPPDPAQALMGGVWIGLGLASLARYVHGRKITALMLEQDQKSRSTPEENLG